MVSSVGSATYNTYLSQLQGTASAASTTGTSSTTTTPASSATNTAQSLVSSLLGNGSGFSSEALSLLQENSSGSFDPITTLLGGTGTNDATTSLYTNLYDAAAAASLTQAQENSGSQTPVRTTTGTSSASGTSTPAATDPVDALINAQTQASIAYNQTLVQNSQSAVQSILNAQG